MIPSFMPVVSMSGVPDVLVVRQTQNARQTSAEIQQQARQVANDAREAAREAARVARENVSFNAAQGAPGVMTVQPPDAPPLPPPPPGVPRTIVIPNGAGEDIHINVGSDGIRVSQGEGSTLIPIHDVVPRGVVDIVQAGGATLVLIVVGWPLARAFARWLDRRGHAAQFTGAVETRLEAMERNIDTVAVELERVSEGQRFTAKLLEQRPLEHAQRSDR